MCGSPWLPLLVVAIVVGLIIFVALLTYDNWGDDYVPPDMRHIDDMLNDIDCVNAGLYWKPLDFKTKEEYADSLSGNEASYAKYWIAHQ